MLPCEQCVYIRYGNLVMALGCRHRHDRPEGRLWAEARRLRASTIYGLVYTIICSWSSSSAFMTPCTPTIRIAMFGMQGCSTEPHFPVRPSAGKVGSGLVPAHGRLRLRRAGGARRRRARRPAALVHRGSTRRSDGWYLIPQWKFMDMACLLPARLRLLRGASPGSSRRLGHARHEEGLILHSVFTRPLRAKPAAVPVQPPTG